MGVILIYKETVTLGKGKNMNKGVEVEMGWMNAEEGEKMETIGMGSRFRGS